MQKYRGWVLSKIAKIPRRGLVPLLCLAVTAPLLLRAEDVVFQKISVEQKLSQSSVSSMLQDKYGFIWIATGDGLNLYDGIGFKIFKSEAENPATLSDNSITCICEGRNGTLWVATEGGLNRYDRETGRFTRYRHDPANSRSLGSDIVRCVREDRQGTVWVGSPEGLDRLDRESGTFTHFRHDPSNTASIGAGGVMNVVEDRRGALWIGTASGLNRFNREAGTFDRYPAASQTPAGAAANPVYAIYEDRRGDIWYGSMRGGLHRFSPGDGLKPGTPVSRFRHDPRDAATLSDDTVTAILEDRSGRLWVGTDRGLNRMDGATGTFTRYLYDPQNPKSLNTDSVVALMEDRSGVLWVGTWGGGVNKVLPTSGFFEHDRAEPGESKSSFEDFVFAIAEDPAGTLWVGTDTGLKRLKAGSGPVRSFSGRGLPDALRSALNVRAIAVDPAGLVWVGGFGQGLYAYDPVRQRVTAYRKGQDPRAGLNDDRVTSLNWGTRGVLWVGTWGGGLSRFDPATKTFSVFLPDPKVSDSLSDRSINVTYEDSLGALWVGTYRGGLDRLDPKNSTFRHFRNDPADPWSISSNQVIAICESRDGALWVGTYGGGLNRLDQKSGRFVRYSEKDGLPNSVVYGILEDESGCVWLSTNNGLSKFDPRTGAFRNYFVEDGLQSNEFNIRAYYKNSRGKMFFGGINGLTSFFPAQAAKDSYVPPIVITAIRKTKAGGGAVMAPVITVPVDGTRDIALARKELPVVIEFVLLDFQNPAGNRYSYRLEGRDQGWNNLGGERTVTIPVLEPGDYVFKVKGANSGGVWNEAGVSVKIHVTGTSSGMAAALAIAGALVVLAALAVLARRRQPRPVQLKHEINWDRISQDYKITKREQEILALMIEGKRNEDIAQALFISEGTVRIHLSHIYQKLNVKNRQQAVNLIITY